MPADFQKVDVHVVFHSTPALVPENYTRRIVAQSVALAAVRARLLLLLHRSFVPALVPC